MTLSTEAAPAPAPELGTRLAQPSRAVNALNRWSGSFFRLTLPPGLGTKARIIGSADEGAKVLSVGMYVGRRTAEVTAIPYDGSRHDDNTPRDESADSLWAYKSRLPPRIRAGGGRNLHRLARADVQVSHLPRPGAGPVYGVWW